MARDYHGEMMAKLELERNALAEASDMLRQMIEATAEECLAGDLQEKEWQMPGGNISELTVTRPDGVRITVSIKAVAE